MRYNRRSLLKVTGAVGISGTFAGCIGGSSDGDILHPSEDENRPTPDEYDSIEEYAEEWRSYASEQAAEELEGNNEILMATSRISDPFDEAFIQRDFSGVYEPLTGNIRPDVASGSDHSSKYAQLAQVENTQYDLLDFTLDRLVSDGVPIGNVSNVPARMQASDEVVSGDWKGARFVWARGMNYNPNVIDPPESFDDILDLPGEQIVTDFAPSPMALGGLIETAGIEFLEELGEKDGVTFDDSGLSQGERVAEGEFGLGILNTTTNVYTFGDQDGLAIDHAPNPDLHFWELRSLSTSAYSEVPWATQLAFDFLMNPENADVQAPRGGTMAVNLEDSNPQELSDLFAGEVWTQNDFDRGADEIVQEYQEVMGAPV